MTLLRAVPLAVFGLGLALTGCESIQQLPTERLGSATLRFANGLPAGTAQLYGNGSEVSLSVALAGFDPGTRGIHLHTTGKCEALRGDDAGCGDFTADNGVANEACSWRGSGDTNRYCEFYDFNADDVLPQDQWRCRTARPNNESCISSLWCGEGLCDDRNDLDMSGDPDFVCRTPISYFPPNTDYCNPYVK